MKYVEKALEKIDPGATEATGEPITAATDLKACACNYTYLGWNHGSYTQNSVHICIWNLMIDGSHACAYFY